MASLLDAADAQFAPLAPWFYEVPQAYSWLKQHLQSNPRRLLHSVGVLQYALRLAQQAGCTEQDTQQVAQAALWHDVAKLQPVTALQQWAQQTQQAPHPDLNLHVGPALHAWVGAAWVSQTWHYSEAQQRPLLDAIRYHTTGAPYWDARVWLVYVADKLEPLTRDPAYVAEMDVYDGHLARTALALLARNLFELQSQGSRYIHPVSYRAMAALRAHLGPEDVCVWEILAQYPCSCVVDNP
jgi:predicted HD superfamily hydrolase involved in NAD metabolism